MRRQPRAGAAPRPQGRVRRANGGRRQAGHGPEHRREVHRLAERWRTGQWIVPDKPNDVSGVVTTALALGKQVAAGADACFSFPPAPRCPGPRRVFFAHGRAGLLPRGPPSREFEA